MRDDSSLLHWPPIGGVTMTLVSALAFGATIILAVHGSGSTEERPTIAFGVGLKTCAWWRGSQENSNQGSIWIEGYWSGRNQQSQHHSPAFVDTLVIWAMVANYCDRHL